MEFVIRMYWIIEGIYNKKSVEIRMGISWGTQEVAHRSLVKAIGNSQSCSKDRVTCLTSPKQIVKICFPFGYSHALFLFPQLLTQPSSTSPSTLLIFPVLFSRLLPMHDYNLFRGPQGPYCIMTASLCIF